MMPKRLLELMRYGVPAVAVGALSAGAAVGAQSTGDKKPAAKGAVSARTTAAPSTARLPGYDPDRNAYFGDLHVHTHLSFDAYIFNVRKTPAPIYRSAKADATPTAYLNVRAMAELDRCEKGWCRVKAPGAKGWVPVGSLWGTSDALQCR
jgi:hypothetical protein